ncbi:MAG: hypothetical protein JWL59_1856 [Chthoniobacteraceae bacterium]|nr:hypothetical protein [Chthoniobacteraceae bacterium]
MATSVKLFHGTLVLTVGRMAGYALSFARNLILARALAKTDYALAAVFSMAMILLEVAGRMAFGQQIIQSNDGDLPEFQSTAHALQFVGGVCGCVLIVALSTPMAYLFGVPHIAWAFASLAVVPLFQGLCHLDISRRQRHFEYVPLILVDVVPQAVTVALTWPMALWFGDYRAIVWLMIGKAVMGTAMTFMFARRRYSWTWNPSYVSSMLSFGWPLLLNGLVMFLSQQADQILVGRVFSLSMLASYSLAFALVSTPWYIFTQVGSALMLPLMSRVQNDPVLFRQQYGMCVQVGAICGVILTLPLVVAGEQIVGLLYGVKYQGSGFVPLLGASFAIRFLRFAPTMASLARGDTISQLYLNLWRGINLPLGIVIILLGGDGIQVAACALVAEFVAVGVSVIQLWQRQSIPIRDNYRAFSFVFILVSISLVLGMLNVTNLNLWMGVVFAIASFIISLFLAWIWFPVVGNQIIETLRQRVRARRCEVM